MGAPLAAAADRSEGSRLHPIARSSDEQRWDVSCALFRSSPARAHRSCWPERERRNTRGLPNEPGRTHPPQQPARSALILRCCCCSLRLFTTRASSLLALCPTGRRCPCHSLSLALCAVFLPFEALPGRRRFLVGAPLAPGSYRCSFLALGRLAARPLEQRRPPPGVLLPTVAPKSLPLPIP